MSLSSIAEGYKDWVQKENSRRREAMWNNAQYAGHTVGKAGETGSLGISTAATSVNMLQQGTLLDYMWNVKTIPQKTRFRSVRIYKICKEFTYR